MQQDTDAFSQLYLDIRMTGKTSEDAWWLDCSGNNWWNRRDCYDFDVLYYVIQGSFQLKVDGVCYLLKQGQMIYLPAGTALEYAIVGEAPLIKYYVHFQARLGCHRLLTGFNSENILTISNKTLLKSLEQLCCIPPEKTGDLFFLHSALLQILGVFFQNFGTKERVKHIANDAVAESYAYMTEHYRQNIRVEQLAKQYGFSCDYYSKKFRARYGCSPVSCLNNIRIRQARRLLADTALTVSQIAEAVGIDDSNYFSRLFKRSVGVSPKKYRMMYQRGDLVADRVRAEASVPASIAPDANA